MLRNRSLFAAGAKDRSRGKLREFTAKSMQPPAVFGHRPRWTWSASQSILAVGSHLGRVSMSMAERVRAITGAVLQKAHRSVQARMLVALAGPPATGKSTLSGKIAEQLNAAGMPCAVLPMDGFHLDNAALEDRGLLHRKGAPDTFDLAGFEALLAKVAQGGACRVPLFDRASDCVRPETGLITDAQKVVLVEGNYLLLDAPGWRDLSRFWDLGVFIDTAMPELRRRLVQRWLDHGLTPTAAEARAEENDLPNARLVFEDVVAASVDLRV